MAVGVDTKETAQKLQWELEDTLNWAAKACVAPVALYGVEAFWPGESKQSATNPSRQKTTNLPVIHRESGVPPANHPISRRIDRRLPPRVPPMRLQRTAALVGKTVRPSLFAKNNGAVQAGPDFRGLPKAKAAEKHLELLNGLPRSTLLAYSDGLQDKHSNTGWGAVIYHNFSRSLAYGPLSNAEVYDAEAVGAFEAIKLARARALANPDIREILLFLDNSALLPRVTTKVAWVPGHKDILGNEEADRLAKEGLELPCYLSNCSTITYIKRWVKKKRREI
ncbi:ribonuclease H-like domain-containing protein [Trichoderma pleuroticola]